MPSSLERRGDHVGHGEFGGEFHHDDLVDSDLEIFNKELSLPNHSAHMRQSRPDSGLVFTVKPLTTFSVVPSSLGKMGNHVSHGEFGGEFEQLSEVRDRGWSCLGFRVQD